MQNSLSRDQTHIRANQPVNDVSQQSGLSIHPGAGQGGVSAQSAPDDARSLNSQANGVVGQAPIYSGVDEVVMGAESGLVEGLVNQPELGVDQVGKGFKEGEPVLTNEAVPLMEVGRDVEMEPEVEGWLEKVERAHGVQLQQPVVHDDQVLVADPSAQVVGDDLVVLPLAYEEVQRGLHLQIYDSMRWLAEWCVRLAKRFGGRVRYQ